LWLDSCKNFLAHICRLITGKHIIYQQIDFDIFTQSIRS